MFYEWVSKGAEIGVTAFFALFVFALCCAVVLGFTAMIGHAMHAGSGDTEPTRGRDRDDLYRR